MATAQEWFLNPWSKMSGHHRPIGTGAIYTRGGGIGAGLLDAADEWTINHGNKFGHPAQFASPSDPVKSINWNGKLSGVGLPKAGLNIPNSFPAPQSNEASTLGGADPNNRFLMQQCYGFVNGTPNASASIRWQLDSRGLGHGTIRNQRVGTSAYHGSGFVGALRKHEIETPGMPIRHVIQASFASWRSVNRNPGVTNLMSTGVQLPATGGDNSGHNNTGPIKYGEVLAIRPQDYSTVVNITNNLPNSSFGGDATRAAIAKEIGVRLMTTLRDWGMLVIDESAGARIRADAAFSPLTLGVDIATVLRATLPQYLYAVTNAVIITGTPATLTGVAGQEFGATTVGDIGTFHLHNGLPVTGGGTPLATINALDNDGSAPEPPPPSEAAMPTGLISAAFGLEASGDPPPPETLSEPTQLSFNFQASSPASVTSSSINPGAGALVRVIVRHRATTQHTHSLPTTTLANMHDFGGGARFTKVWDSANDGVAKLRITEWWGYSTGATGDGAITANFSAAPENASIEVIRFAENWEASPNGLIDTTEGVGTSWTVQLPSAPTASSRLIMALLQNATADAGTLPAGWTQLTKFYSNNHLAITAYAPGSVGAGPHTITDLPNLIKAGGLLETLQA